MNEYDGKQQNLITKIKAMWASTSVKSKMGVLSFFAVLLAISVSTVMSVMINPDTFSTQEGINAWLVRSAILSAISIYGILDGLNVSLENAMKKETGLYQRNFNTYRNVAKIALEHGSFAEWYVPFVIGERTRVMIEYLFDNGISEAKFVYEHIGEIDLEKLAYEDLYIDETKIRRKLPEQIDAIKKVKDGKVNIKAPEWSYYLTKSVEGNKSRSIVEVGYELDSLEKKELYGITTLKILWNIASRVLMAVLTVGDLMQLNNWQSWFDLAMRVFALCSAFYSGTKTGLSVARTRALKVENKTMVLEKYNNDVEKGRFKERTEEDGNKQEINPE